MAEVFDGEPTIEKIRQAILKEFTPGGAAYEDLKAGIRKQIKAGLAGNIATNIMNELRGQIWKEVQTKLTREIADKKFTEQIVQCIQTTLGDLVHKDCY